MKIDMHVHSIYSGHSTMRPETIIDLAAQKGIDIAITDHSTTKAYAAMKHLGKKAGVQVIQGEEIDVQSNGKHLGELMALFLQEPLKSNELYSVIDEVKAQGALLSVPHPFDLFRTSFKGLDSIASKIDAIETFNSRVYFAGSNKKADEFAEKHSLAKLAGSDAHLPREVGKALTCINADSLDEAKKEIKNRNTLIVGEKSGFDVHISTTILKIKNRFFRRK